MPNESPHPLFLQVDFAVCAGENGRLTPRLIELQGFPSLYSYQLFFWRCLQETFPDLPAGWQPFFSGLDAESYLALLRSVIVGEADPENVILLDIEPERQKTRIDFAACRERPRRAPGLPNEYKEARPSALLRAQGPRDPDRAHL